jgi:HlyD family secretion protein
MMKAEQHLVPRRSKYLLPVILGLVAAALGLGGWQVVRTGTLAGALPLMQWATGSTVQQEPAAYDTSVVRRGDIALSINGTGQVVTVQSVDLAFPVSGIVGELNVQVGDAVKQSEVLAVLANLDELEQAVKNQELAAARAEQALADLLSQGEATLAQARAAQVSAQEAYEEAQKGLHRKGDARCAPSLTQEYYFR